LWTKTFSSKGVTVFQPQDYFDTQNGVVVKGRIFVAALMPKKNSRRSRGVLNIFYPQLFLKTQLFYLVPY
jgi:hypothetical protein